MGVCEVFPEVAATEADVPVEVRALLSEGWTDMSERRHGRPSLAGFVVTDGEPAYRVWMWWGGREHPTVRVDADGLGWFGRMAVDQLPENPIHEGDDVREAAIVALRELAEALAWVRDVAATARPHIVVGLGRPPDR